MKWKFYEQNFDTKSKAVEVLGKAGWKYVGRKGVFKKYDLYEGVTTEAVRVEIYDSISDAYYDFDVDELNDVLEAKLSSDGHVEIYQDRKKSKSVLLGTTGMPSVHCTYLKYQSVGEVLRHYLSMFRLSNIAVYISYDFRCEEYRLLISDGRVCRFVSEEELKSYLRVNDPSVNW